MKTTAKMVGKLRVPLAILLMVMLFAPASAEQEPSFRMDMDSLNLQTGVSSSLVISITNAQNAQIDTLDGFAAFDVYSQGTSTSTSTVNGVVTHQSDAYYTILPKSSGQFTLKANINYGGQNYETNTLDVIVTEGNDTASGALPDLFSKTILSKDEAYLGEKLTITFELYSRDDVESLGFTDYTSIDGAVVKELPGAEITAEAIYLDGNRYIKYIVKQLIVDPLKTGTLTIPSFNMQVNTLSQSSAFGGFGGLMIGSTPKYISTEAATLNVKALPSAGRPDDFSGIVGELSLTGEYSRNELNYGDSLALNVVLSGECNLDGVKNIFGGTIPGFIVYENQKAANESIEDGVYHIQKTIEAILVPEKNGSIEIPPVSISYFNPTTGQYETAKVPGATINVLGDMPTIAYDSRPAEIERETVLIDQVRYGGTDDGALVLRIPKEPLIWVVIGLLCAILLVFSLTKLKKRNPEIKTMYRRAMAAKDANEVYNSANAMIKHCCGLNIKACSKSSVASTLSDSDFASQIVAIMDFMESPEACDGERLKKMVRSLYSNKLRKL